MTRAFAKNIFRRHHGTFFVVIVGHFSSSSWDRPSRPATRTLELLSNPLRHHHVILDVLLRPSSSSSLQHSLPLQLFNIARSTFILYTYMPPTHTPQCELYTMVQQGGDNHCQAHYSGTAAASATAAVAAAALSLLSLLSASLMRS